MSDDLKQLKKELVELAASFKSPNQFAYAKAWGAGKSQVQAYIDAGYKSKNPTVDAFKAVERCPIIAQYKNLLQKIAQIELTPKQIATFEQKRNMLWSMAQIASKSVLARPLPEGDEVDDLTAVDADVFNHNAIKAAQSCIAELNKMDGDLAVIKTENKNSHAFDDLTEAQIDKRIADLQRKT